MIRSNDDSRRDAPDRTPVRVLREQLSRSLGPTFQAIGSRVAIELNGDFDWLTDPTLGGANGIDEWELDRLPFAASVHQRGYVVCLTPVREACLRDSLRETITLIIRSVEWRSRAIAIPERFVNDLELVRCDGSG